jgi:hypothetical protein
MQVKGPHLSDGCGAICVAGPVQMLVAIATAQGLHSPHPEMVSVGTQHMHGLAESQLDSEPVAVQLEYLQRREGEVGRQQEDGAALGMADDHETHHAGGGTPDQVQTAVGPALRKRQEDVPEQIKEIAWKAQVRLSKRYAKLAAAGKDQRKIVTAVGRELLGFIWAIGIKAEEAAMQKIAA